MYYYLGLDLGQSKDYTALVFVEEHLWLGSEVDWDQYKVVWPDTVEPGGWVSPTALAPRYANNVHWVNVNYGRPAHPPLHVRGIKRFELGTKYDQIIGDVKGVLTREPIRRRLGHTSLLVDKTGVGAPTIDHFWAAGVRPISVTIHGGSRVIAEPNGFRVPKRDLVSAVQVLIQNNRLHIAPTFGHSDTLRKELRNFKIKQNPATAHESYEHWREGDHDDLVLATAMACWLREYLNREIEERNVQRGGFKDWRGRVGEHAG